eukprot:CAMPEP_0117434574 /NCGR_PEP_ID=MMETSP0759-20121206/23_1 /TAXON_ID=63605 /ORGANISM="Percolomonas cosmopolitus, Strain WS" /LENGTH=326 /DNA_ID=CAMNT_0005226069 /DNA_START=36 /DNA_END=1016 /DNA_ORIENTATION=+
MTSAKHLLKIIKLPPQTPLYQYLLLEEALLRESAHSYIIMLNGTNRECVVSGVGNKPHEWLNQSYLHENRQKIPIIKRYTGGGSVVASQDTLFVSFVLSKALVPQNVELFPRPIMKWSEKVYKPVFGEQFELLEYDYVWKCDAHQEEHSTKRHVHGAGITDSVRELNEDLLEKEFFDASHNMKHEDKPDHSFVSKKFGGNAQYMTGGKKQRFCHHTSFLWDFNPHTMNSCLVIPSKKPDYRDNRTHDDFLIRMKDMQRFTSRDHFFELMERRFREMANGDEWRDHVEMTEETMEDAWQYVEKNTMVGTRYIDPLTGEKIEWEEEYL